MANPFTDEMDILQTLPLFHDLTPRQLEIVANIVTFGEKSENEVVMRTAATGGLIYLILTGYVKICTPRTNETDLILGLRGAGEVLGEMSIVDAQEKSATVITHTACDLAWIKPDDFWGVLWEFAPVPYNLAHLLNQRIRRLNSALNVLAPCQSELRLARQLLLLSREFGQETPHDDLVMLPFPLSAADLSGLTAMPLPEIAELMRDWQRAGIIGSVSGPDSPFVVRDSAALQALAD